MDKTEFLEHANEIAAALFDDQPAEELPSAPAAIDPATLAVIIQMVLELIAAWRKRKG